ncbi:glycosyltransferase family 2 protein [Allobranchiibius huperziae]|uniref:Glycosyltransferase involved in cell wall biosynthesis n=1 Tax=Allobranchiibius huperziae TaxID=1874116 RepID=A0A853DK95_9MICO|nr:glycosyltransferase [Allobranchiibius huperziae]NYJ76359.1 glycosyltransferase involved in cell wall biosynthesis [Allobranchiibius huperziae]
MPPAATVIVPTLGGAERLPRLFAALEQQEGTTYECVVVLDGQVDDSAAVVQSWSGRIPVRSVAFPENRGRSAALNAGRAAAQGRVLIRCDDDLAPAPSFVAAHVAHHDRPEPVGVVGMCPEVFPDNAYVRAYGQTNDDLVRESSYALAPDQAWRRWSANVSVTDETWDRVGPYDDAFRVYGWEDIDWGYRLHLLGIPVLVPRDLEAPHHNPATSATERAERAYHSGASRRVFEAKHGSDALGADRLAMDSPWNVAVRATGGVLRSDGAVRLLGRGVDGLLPRVSPSVGHKLVALLVEGSGVAATR